MILFYATYQYEIEKNTYKPFVEFFFAENWKDAVKKLEERQDEDTEFEDLGIVWVDGEKVNEDWIPVDDIKEFEQQVLKRYDNN
jgi:hypothetical protein